MLLGNRLNLLFILTGLFYLAVIPFRPFLLDPVVKIVPIAILFFAAYSQLSGKLRMLTILGIFFCGMGDVLLTLTSESAFVMGLGAFLTGHLFYVICFSGFANKEHLTQKVLLICVVLFVTVGMALKVLPIAGDLTIPVAAYICVIATMGIFAVLSWRLSFVHILGAFSFIISDSMIAWNMFLEPIPYSRHLIMTTYYLAQILIIGGILKMFTERQINNF